jgi:hypothetical protein
MMQKTGQVSWMKMPAEQDGCVELRLRRFGPDRTVINEGTIYQLRKSHGAFNKNLGLLVAASIPGHVVTLFLTENNEIMSVAIGSPSEP